MQEIGNACLTLNTADYCLQTSLQVSEDSCKGEPWDRTDMRLQLEERLKETIDEAFKDQVSFEAEQEQFVG